MALVTGIAWAAVLSSQLMEINGGLNVVLNVGIVWAAVLVVLIGVLVVGAGVEGNHTSGGVRAGAGIEAT